MEQGYSWENVGGFGEGFFRGLFLARSQFSIRIYLNTDCSIKGMVECLLKVGSLVKSKASVVGDDSLEP